MVHIISILSHIHFGSPRDPKSKAALHYNWPEIPDSFLLAAQ
jgi:hypothetical protein